jgi:hypothetical protein
VTALFAAPQDTFRSAPPEEEAALRARVNGFYSLFQQGKYRQAEGFVVEESRDLFYNAPKARIYGYEIKNLEFNSDLNEARVLVTVETMTPMSAQPIKQPLQSEWNRVEGEWYMSLKAVPAGQAYQTPAGPMHFPEGGSSPPAGFKPPNLGSMQTMYEVDTRNLEFPTDAKEAVTHIVTVKNKFQEPLTIEPLTRNFPGMEIKLGSEAIPKDGETTIAFTYHPDLARLVGNKHFDFDLMPITQRVRIVLSFR